jgi:hypothetical protein
MNWDVVAIAVAAVATGLSVHFFRRSFRPIVTAAVKTHASGNTSIAYNLVIQNSGTIPAKNIRIEPDPSSLAAALGSHATDDDKNRWLACFEADTAVAILQNGDRTLCSFGMTMADNKGFWKYGSTIFIVVRYEGWFGGRYDEWQTIRIVDSDSFTGRRWASRSDTLTEAISTLNRTLKKMEAKGKRRTRA